MDFTKINRLVAYATLGISLIVYTLTVAPTVSYWDCGEFITAAFNLGIPHPPGPPMFLIAGRVAAIFAGDPTQAAFAMNYLSVLSSAFTIFFMYLSIMMLFNEWKGKVQEQFEFWMRSSAAVIGSLAFAFSHTFWFNAVETEMYAHHMLLTSLMVWLTLRWAENHENKGSDRYLLMIAYIIGISTGIHIVTLLNIPFVAVIYYVKRYKDRSFIGLAAAAFIGLVVSLIVYPGVIKYFPTIVRALGDMMWGLIILLIFLGGVFYVWYSNQHRVLRLGLTALTLVMIGYSSFSVIYIRSNLDPIIDENNPETLNAFISYINREQYGSMSTFPRRWSVKGQSNGKTWVGDGTGVLHQFGPGNVRKIKSVTELGSQPSATQHLGAQLEYTWNYQFVHMLFRYMGWNYLGVPEGEPQDAMPDLTRFFFLPLLLFMFGAVYQFSKDFKLAAVMAGWLLATVLFYSSSPPIALILVLAGGVGLYFTFKNSFKDDVSFHGWALLAIFIMSGIALQIYLNQNEPQPRERDYTSVAVFYTMAIWISYGVYALMQFIREQEEGSTMPGYVLGVLLIVLIPGNMLWANYKEHDRSGNTVAWDYSYNILMSCDENAILFTNGDNDTFPIWYLQTVEGVRPDVSAVNLSLLNTPWYIKQQKSGQLGKAVPISYSDQEIDTQYDRPIRWDKPRSIKLEVPAEVRQNDIKEASLFTNRPANVNINSPQSIQFELGPQMTIPTANGNVGLLRVQDLITLNMIVNNRWKRPLNWAVTVGSGNLLGGLSEYMRMDGLVYKLTSEKGWQIDPVRLERLLLEVYRYNLSDPSIYLNENIKGLVGNMRSSFLQLAQYHASKGNVEKQKEIIREMNERISQELIPINNPNIQVLIDIVTKLDTVAAPTEETFNAYSNSQLDLVWRNAHFIKNSVIRDAAISAHIARLPVGDRNRRQLVLYQLSWVSDTAKKNALIKRYEVEYATDEQFLKFLKRR